VKLAIDTSAIAVLCAMAPEPVVDSSQPEGAITN
jgi:hypothetical protein